VQDGRHLVRVVAQAPAAAAVEILTARAAPPRSRASPGAVV